MRDGTEQCPGWLHRALTEDLEEGFERRKYLCLDLDTLDRPR